MPNANTLTPVAGGPAAGGGVRLRTRVPGPESERWMARRAAAVPRGPFHASPIFIARAEGALVEDVDGNVLLDFAGGLGCLAVGHSAPDVVEAVQLQATRYLHACFHVTPNDGYVRLAEALNARTPGAFAKKTLLVNSGAEGVENAVKIARAYTGRPAVIAFEDGFHGRTLLAMTLTSKTHPYKAGFGPFAPEIYRMPYAYCYRCAAGLEPATCGTACAGWLDDVFRRTVAAESVAAVVIEPVLGEGGFVAPPREFLAGIADRCRREGILLIADEVQTGYGRTGALFASEVYGIEPDLLVAGKSLASGLPLASVTGRAEVMDAAVTGGLGGTYGGNPLACAAALAVLESYDALGLGRRAATLGSAFVERTASWHDRFAVIGEIRGLGAMQGIELVRDRATLEPAPDETARLIQSCRTQGLIVMSAGTYGNVVRLLMPLVTTDTQFQAGLDILETAFSEIQAGRHSA